MPALPTPLPLSRLDAPHGPVAFFDTGDGEPILLIHGFASTAHVNWVYPGWVDTLTRAGRRVIALDNRGHGASAKLYDPTSYHTTRMADDARLLMDHLGLGRIDVMGYSMGARITAFLTVAHPDRVRSATLGGLGIHLVDGVGLPESIASALEANDPDAVTDPMGRMFRTFADQTRSDRLALAACIRGSRNVLSEADVRSIACPVLIAVGTRDRLAGQPEPLARLIPKGEALAIPDRDHMPAVGDKVFKSGVLDFLARRP